MQPIYDRSGISLYLGDSSEVLKELPAKSFDLLLTDPPYGVNFVSNRRTESFGGIAGDDAYPFELVEQAFTRLRPFRHAYLFGLGAPTDRLPLGGQVELVWDKANIGMGDLSSPWGPQHEKLLFGVYAPSKANRARGDGRLAARLRKGSVLRVLRANATGVKNHPTEKPVDVLRQLIESSSMLGERVLDPFVGSGSTLVAAALEGRSGVGIEIDERYVEVAVRRLDAVLDALDAVAA